MKLFQNYILKNHRAIVLMALFSWTSAKVLGNSVKSDTLIIDGKTIHVQVKEKSEYEKEQHTDKSEVDSVTQSEKCTKYLGVFSSAGICDNRINHKSGPLLLEEFIGEESLKGNYKEFGIEFLLETPRNIWLGANFSFLNWEIRQNKYVGDYSSFFRFENYSQGELTQIDRYKEGIGFEFDTLNANLIRERNSEKFLLLGAKLGAEFFKKRKKKKFKHVGFVGFDYFSLKSIESSEFDFIESVAWTSSNSENFSSSKSGGILNVEWRTVWSLSNSLCVSPSVRYRFFSSSYLARNSEFDLRKSSLGLGVNFSFLF